MATRASRIGIVAAVTALVATAACGGGEDQAQTKSLDFDDLVTTTKAGSGDAGKITWNLPYEPLSLDPIKSFNYAENTALANMCESLLLAKPNYQLEPGLAESYSNPNPTTWVYKIRPNVKFWNGEPLTAEDVAYSIGRNLSPDSYWAKYFASVESIEATGDLEVTIKLKEPDAFLNQALAAGPGIVTEKASTKAAGRNFGTPGSDLMCTGPFEYKSWKSGASITMVRNEEYWNDDRMAKSSSLELRFITDESTAVLALDSGEIDGEYFYTPPAGLEKLRSSSDVTVTFGESLIYWTLIGSSTEGAYADPRIRKALLLATDRAAIAKTVFQGAAIPTRSLASPSYWTYAKDTFKKAYEELPGTEVDIETAKALVKEAGSPDDTITIAIQGSSAAHEQTANLLQAAGESIGLTVEIKVVPVEQYGNIYVDPKAREGVDAFLSTYYQFPDPLDVFSVFTPGDRANYSQYDEVGDLIATARAELDGQKRAELTTEIQKKVTEDGVWLPLAYMPTILVQNDRITGATASSNYLYYPWAVDIGTK